MPAVSTVVFPPDAQQRAGRNHMFTPANWQELDVKRPRSGERGREERWSGSDALLPIYERRRCAQTQINANRQSATANTPAQ